MATPRPRTRAARAGDAPTARVIAAERARLAGAVLGAARAALVRMQQRAREAEANLDPGALSAIQEGGRRATIELRRLLGLLRSEPEPEPSPVPASRLRRARELHDLASRAVAVMVLHAGVALAQRSLDPDRARDAVRIVQAAGVEAGTALRTLDDLIGPVDGPDDLDDLAAALVALVGRMARTGLQVSLSAGAGLPGGTDHATTAYRVVQESLANAVRYAPDASVEVRVRRAAGVLEVRVRDNGVPGPPEAPGPSAGGGFGLAGLAERVLAHGGEFAAGPGPEGGFTVTARWPDRAGQANPDPASTMSG